MSRENRRKNSEKRKSGKKYLQWDRKRDEKKTKTQKEVREINCEHK